jgi:S-adenosylmethionine-diacylglycerol 3-amino-3-carboxypropyl transferase
MRHSTKAVRNATGAGLKAAVHRAKPLSRAGVLERMFTLAFLKARLRYGKTRSST